MCELVVMDWLEEYNSLSESEVRSYAMEQQSNHEVIIALNSLFEEHAKHSNLVDPVCNQLYGFYRSGEEELQRFTLQFIPPLVLIYLESLTVGERRVCRNVEALLIGVYNLEVVDKSGQPKVISFRIPSIAQASIYHEPVSAYLTMNSLRRWEECNSNLVNWGPLQQVETLNSQNRLRVITALFFIFNQHLCHFPCPTLETVCKVSSRLVTQGFHSYGSHVRLSMDSDSSYLSSLPPRIALSNQLLLELLYAIHFALTDETLHVASQALEDVYSRACYETYADVLLVANSMKDLLHVTRSGSIESVINTGVAQVAGTSVSKSMITNASFRTKKLPEDIPIQTNAEGGGDFSLLVISEEKEEKEDDDKIRTRGSSLRSSKEIALAGVKNIPKTFSGLSKMVKETKASLKGSPNPASEKDKADQTRKSIELEKDSVKYVKDDHVKGDETDYKRLISSDSEKMSLVSDSFQTGSEFSDTQSSNGVALDGFNDKSNVQNTNSVHVSNV